MTPELIKGNTHTDSRGTVRFVNDFDMTKVVRMYCIEPEVGTIRAWQGHKIESKWFYVVKGCFTVKTIQIENPEVLIKFRMTEKDSQVLHIPRGYFNGFEATEKGSVIIVFSDADLETSKADDYRKTLADIPWIK
jgi:dTDP-4-dehydrorhamnose 3,5-epimerase